MSIREMTELLQNVSAGPVPSNLVNPLLEQTAQSWSEFEGSDATNMAAWKIRRDDGATDWQWDPPILSFRIERHGGTVLGSSRAEKQRWRLNLKTQVASHQIVGHRQLRPNAPKLDVKSLAERVSEALQEGPMSRSDLVTKAIAWKGDEVEVKSRNLIPIDGPKRTVQGRVQRFRGALIERMTSAGWQRVSSGNRLKFKKIK
jgi:hypothetical protein